LSPGPYRFTGIKEDRVEVVLLAIRLGLDEEHLLREPIGGIGLLGITRPEVLLTKRDGSELRGSADGDELPDACQAGFFQGLGPHHEVFVEEAAGILPVRADASDDGSGVDHDLRLGVSEKPADRIAVQEIVVLLAGHKDIASGLAEPLDDAGAHEAGSARDDGRCARLDNGPSLRVAALVNSSFSGGGLASQEAVAAMRFARV